jgi:xanthine dehydrogenase C subunit
MSVHPVNGIQYPEVWHPADLAEAWKLKQRFGADAVFAAGATLLRTQWESGLVPLPTHLIDLGSLKGLLGVRASAGRFAIGALTPLATVRSDSSVRMKAPAIAEAAAAIAAHSVRQLATIGGNVVSRVGDSLPALVAHDAELVWEDEEGERITNAETWLDLVRSGASWTSILKEIRIPDDEGIEANRFHAYRKVGRREAFTPSLVTVAMAGILDGEGRFERIRFAAGGGITLTQRLYAAERALIGLKPGVEAAEAVYASVSGEFQPAADPFASVEYRVRTAANLLSAEVWKLSRGAASRGGLQHGANNP